jgi:hypothetical protein
MEIHKYERPEGVALLKQEATKADAEAVKQRLSSAILRACNCGAAGQIERLGNRPPKPGTSKPTQLAGQYWAGMNKRLSQLLNTQRVR